MRSTTDRRQLLLETLCHRRYDTISNLANEFGVNRRTIERDILVLSCSYPLLTFKGSGGGVKVVNGFKIGMRYLNEEQSTLLQKLSDNLSGDDFLTMQSILKMFSKPSK